MMWECLWGSGCDVGVRLCCGSQVVMWESGCVVGVRL